MTPLVLLAALWCAAGSIAADQRLSIAGEWRFRLDPDDAGMQSGWFNSHLPERIWLPGSTDEHHLGIRNDAREPRRFTRAYEYTGAAWYQRDIVLPDTWQGKRITLLLERCHWETQAWVDDQPLGLQNSLSTPHLYDFGANVSPGSHRLTVRVDNRLKIDVGPWASAITEEGPGNWNGIVGRLELSARDPVWIRSVQVYPDERRKSARVKVKVRNATGQAQAARLTLRVTLRGQRSLPAETTLPAEITDRPETALEMDAPLGDSASLWDEFSPSLYDLSVRLVSTTFSDEARTSFGVRQITTAGRELRWNGRRILLRGTVDNGAFPEHGYPPTDIDAWRRRFQAYREHGMNHVRFHSWCPPDAAFSAADELGLILQVENPMWIGNGRISSNALRTAFIRQEAESIVDNYGNHPSFALMSMGNELGDGLDLFLGELVNSLRARDPRRLYTSTSAPDNLRRPDDYFVSAGPRWQNLRGDPRLEQNPPNTEFNYRQYLAAIDRPVIAHELGQWTVFPNLAEAARYRGPLQPRYFDFYRESLERHGLLAQAESFRRASGAFMVILYKEEIEAILRTRELSGFQLLGLTDWPGFGPAFIGVLDALNESKGLIPPADFRRFCGPTVPLLRLKKRLWTTGETLTAELEVAHYGPSPIHAEPQWTLRNPQGQTLASGKLPSRSIPTGAVTPLGGLQVPLARLAAPAQYSIEVAVGSLANHWDVWLYPATLPAAQQDFLLVHTWDSSARQALERGQKVVFFPTRQVRLKTVPISFTTVFWSLLWFPKRAETMGILCNPRHAAFAVFPTASHSDWQWWDLTSRSRAFLLTGAPPDFRPLVQVIDDVNRNYRLGAVFEARVGAGKLLAASFDLETDLENRLAARQLRYSLLRYAGSAAFDPPHTLAIDFVDQLLAAEER